MSTGFQDAFGIGGASVQPHDVATDSAGNRYVVGSFAGTVNFDSGPGVVNKTAAGRDVFIAKYSPTGGLLWVDQVGGTGDDDGFGIALDGAGNVWVTGSFIGTADFDPGPGTANLNSGVGFAPFVLRLNSNGGFLGVVGATTPSFGRNQALAIATDNQGNAYISGEVGTGGVFGGVTLTPTGNTDVFVAKATPSGSNLAFSWAKSFPSAGGSPISQGNSIATDASGNVYVAGMFAGTVNFPTPLTSAGNQDVFVAKLAQGDGTTLAAQRFGGAQYDVGDSIVVGAGQNPYLSGHFEGTVAFGGATAPLTAPAGGGIFVLKLNSSLQPLAATNLNASSGLVGFAGGTALAVDPVGSGVLVAGNFKGTANPGGISLTSAGDNDVLMAQINSAGVVTGAQRGGGIGSDLVGGIAANPSGAIALVGQYTPPATFGPSTLPNRGTQNMFVAQLSSQAPPVSSRSVPNDYDGDGKSDIGVFRPSTASWFILQSTDGPRVIDNFGAAYTDIPVPGDYDGDGKTDIAVYRPSTASWFIIGSTAGPMVIPNFGAANLDVPVPADYDGDGKTDLAVYRPTTATWLILQSSAGPRVVPNFGAAGSDIPIPADYDGDGKTDIAVFRPSTASWFILQSTDGPRVIPNFGAANTDQPIPADYDGDGKADVAVFRPSTASWFILQSMDGPRVISNFGAANLDIPIPADYDGDGKADVAVFRPSTASWFILQSTDGPRVIPNFGAALTDLPLTVPQTYRYLGGLRFTTQAVRTRGVAPTSLPQASATATPAFASTTSASSNVLSVPLSGPRVPVLQAAPKTDRMTSFGLS